MNLCRDANCIFSVLYESSHPDAAMLRPRRHRFCRLRLRGRERDWSCRASVVAAFNLAEVVAEAAAVSSSAAVVVMERRATGDAYLALHFAAARLPGTITPSLCDLLHASGDAVGEVPRDPQRDERPGVGACAPCRGALGPLRPEGAREVRDARPEGAQVRRRALRRARRGPRREDAALEKWNRN